MILKHEPSLDPPEDKYYIADCGCEVYEGDAIYEWNEGYICEECFKLKINEMKPNEIADYMGIDHGLAGDWRSEL